MKKLNCWFGKHDWDTFKHITKSKPPHYERCCKVCNKVQIMSELEHKKLLDNGVIEINKCFNGIFRVIDIRLEKGHYQHIYEDLEDVIEMLTNVKKNYTTEHFIKVKDNILDSIDYLYRGDKHFISTRMEEYFKTIENL